MGEESRQVRTSVPNVLLVVMDTARADAFEPYGASAGDTPTVAQLAATGRAYRNVFSTANWTLPSHASLFSGLHPTTTGLGQAPDGPLSSFPRLEALRRRLLPEVLRQAGFATSGVSTNMWITDKSGFATGFDRFEVVRPVHRGRIDGTRIRDRVRWDLDAVRAVGDDGATEVARIIENWLYEPRHKPFFWFVNLTECHSPYLPPRPYNDLPIMDRLRAGKDARRHLTLTQIFTVCLGADVVPADAVARMRHLYRRAVRYMDDWLARILQMLDEARLLEDTVIIVTSDHGENLGESNLIGHSFSLDDRLIRVPFVSSHADLLDSEGAHSLADVPGSLSGVAGILDHPYDGCGSLNGVAVAELERMVEPSDPRAESAMQKMGLDEIGFRRLTTSAWCATDGRYKLLRSGDQETLYDLVSDPLELAPISAGGNHSRELSTVIAALRSAGEATLDQQWDGFEDVVPESNGQSSASEVNAEELQAIESQMRRLGYL